MKCGLARPRRHWQRVPATGAGEDSPPSADPGESGDVSLGGEGAKSDGYGLSPYIRQEYAMAGGFVE